MPGAEETWRLLERRLDAFAAGSGVVDGLFDSSETRELPCAAC